MGLPSYPKVYNLGHRDIADLFLGPVVVQEKVDGSQFSFGVVGGVLHARTHHNALNVAAPGGMFESALVTIRGLQPKLLLDHVYFGEYLSKPKHNALAYDRVPSGHVILFDVQDTASGQYLPPGDVAREAEALGLESVPVLYTGLSATESLVTFANRVSILGGQEIEGVVIKNYARGLMGKYVTSRFRELRHEHPAKNTGGMESLVARYATKARWQKAVIHLEEQGLLQHAPEDIKNLLTEVGKDVINECGEEIRAALWEHWWPQIRRGIARGLPEWYKEQLAKNQPIPQKDASAGSGGV